MNRVALINASVASALEACLVPVVEWTPQVCDGCSEAETCTVRAEVLRRASGMTQRQVADALADACPRRKK